MSQTSMSFSRQNSYTTQEYNDSIKYNISSSPDFGKGNKATRGYFTVTGLTNGTASAATRAIRVQIETSDGAEYDIWTGDVRLSKSGTSGASVSIGWFDIPSAYQYEIANKTISAVYVIQDSDYSVRGVSGSGTLTFEYESAATRCTAPSSVSISGATTADSATLSWQGASAGSYNAIKSYYIEYADSSDGVSWAAWNYYYTLETSATYGSISVALPGTGNYRKFRIWTFGGLINSETATESSACYHAYTPSAPGSLSPAAGGYTSLSAISWGAVSCADPVQGYVYQISTDGGASWGAETTTTATSADISSLFNSAGAAARILFRVRAYTNWGASSGWSTSGVFYRRTLPTAPSAVSISTTTTTDSAATLSWSGASAGINNAIKSYLIQYADSSNGSSWTAWSNYYTLTTTATYGSISVALPDAGKYRKFRVQTIGEAQNSSTATESGACYHAYTPSAPGSLSPAAGGYTSLSAISWGAVSCADPIQGYAYQISTDGGASWGAETTTTATSVNISSWFNSIGASARVLFRVRAYTNKGISSGWSTSGTFYRKVSPQAPTAFSASPASFGGGNITLQWSGASDPEDNIAGYEIEVATSSNGSTWTGYSSLKTIQSTAASGSATDTPNMADGTYRRYRIRTKDGDGLYSGYRESNSVYRLQSPTMPEILSPSAGYYQTSPIVSWKASTAPDNNLAGYLVRISIDGGTTWSPESATTATIAGISSVFDAAPLTAAFVVQVRAYTTGGTYSNYATSATFYRNTPVVAPKLLSPLTQAVRAGRIWAFIQCAAKDNGLAQTLYYQSPNGERTTLAPGKTEAFSIAYPLTASGSHTFILADSTGASAETSVSVSLVKTKYTDAAIEAGTTPTRAAHIAEPRADVESILAAYGMPDAGWSETVEAGTTSLRHFNSHILEMRKHIEVIRKKINDFSGESKISAFSWCELSDAGPKADAIKEIRSAISKL